MVALRKPEIFSGLEVIPLDKTEKKLEEVEEVELRKLAKRLQDYMEREQIFLNPDLNLKELASQLSVPPRELSRAINRIHEQSFFDYINRHRIELAKEKIQHPKDPKVTVLEIMYEVGFQSKSSFNTAFKKFTGLTPTQWKRQAKR
ncbi:MAG: helix-turn-helix domain-containing protein [Bacteroidota bacterium]